MQGQQIAKKVKRRCYYEVLQVARDATLLQIKAAYRKLALKYHPDKNTEDTKQKFVEIQEAWKILSDVNQRTWYDNNRDQVLFNKHEMSAEDFQMQTFGFNIKQYLSNSCFKDLTDAPDGFYSVYRKLFETIKEEERKAYQFNKVNKDKEQNQEEQQQGQFRKYMGFGDSNSKIEDVIKFYNDWESFQSFKTFAWADEYSIKQAQNRQQRRWMQKQNKKERVKQRKRYITAIKQLITFVKRRDPRKDLIQEHLKRERELKEELKKKKAEQDRIRRIQMEKQRLKQLEQTRLRMEAMKTEQEKERDRLRFIQPPKIQEKRVKLVKHQCPDCMEIFKDFNKHFQHIQKTGHTKV